MSLFRQLSQFIGMWAAFVLVIVAPVGVSTVRFVAAAATPTVEASYTQSGPYATTTGTATDPAGENYDLFYPSDYAALGFLSPIVTWGNGSGATPAMYSELLGHFASYGFTVIASTLANTGSGHEIADGARFLVAQNSAAGSVFAGHLDVAHVASVGHSQGATGAVTAAVDNPSLVTAVETFSLPNTKWAAANPDCPTAAACTAHVALLTQPTFLIGTHGLLDSVIAPPATEKADFAQLRGPAALGLIQMSGGAVADHNSIQDSGSPTGEFGYATGWLEYELRGDPTAGAAFEGAHPELMTDSNWPASLAK